MAIRLEKGIGSSAAAWLRMQMAFDLAAAQRTAKSIKVKKLAKASWAPRLTGRFTVQSGSAPALLGADRNFDPRFPHRRYQAF
jgi:hypothetical protein